MAPKGQKTSLKDALALLEDPTPTDFDPEALEDAQMEDANDGESGASGSEEEEGFDGREHYVAVGKSKLRKPDAIPLDPKYNGAPVSRSKLGQDDESEAESAGSDGDEDDNEGSEEDEEESFGGFESEEAGSGSEDDKSGSDEEGSDEEMDDDEASDDNDDDDDEDDDSGSEDEEQKKRAELKKMMAEEQKAVVSSVSEAAKADIAKGNAVRQQQTTFDAFLGARIKLQKALVVANSPTEDIAEVNEDTDMEDSIKAAEEAVLGLWSLITDLRHDLADARTGTDEKESLKRKRTEMEVGANVEDMWFEMKKLDAGTRTWRNNTLEKWSSKVQGITVVPVSQRLNNTVTQHSVTAQIRETLTDSERLVKRTRIPRSCAPVQASKKVEEDPEVFDDTDFYQLLLKALVDQKLVDSSTGAASSGVRWKQAMREAKKRKNVDTKASKGRKLKYSVHEKLQNFMAPNPILSWHEEQINELFASLLGQRARVEDESESEAEDVPDDGLRLFGRA